MSPNKVILLACGSFNPPTHMHLRMFEIARDHLHRIGNEMVLGGIISPVHDSYGKKDLENLKHRLEMIRLSLDTNDWIRLSDWECRQETWTRTRQVLQHHQNQLNSILQSTNLNELDINENDCTWMPESIRNLHNEHVKIKLLCGADLLESFGTPGLWADEDINAIVGQHGLVVITRSKTNPLEFIYNSDLLTKYMYNITIVTEWIRNEVSSTKIRKALRRSESVKYLLSDDVIDYIVKNNLYDSKHNKYLTPTILPINNSLTPSPLDVSMESPNSLNCLMICNNNLFSRKQSNDDDKHPLLDDDLKILNRKIHTKLHPGQAVKIITENTGEHKIMKNNDKVCNSHKLSKKYDTNDSLKDCKNCDANLIKFIFTKHGIQVISDVETIV